MFKLKHKTTTLFLILLINNNIQSLDNIRKIIPSKETIKDIIALSVTIFIIYKIIANDQVEKKDINTLMDSPDLKRSAIENERITEKKEKKDDGRGLGIATMQGTSAPAVEKSTTSSAKTTDTVARTERRILTQPKQKKKKKSKAKTSNSKCPCNKTNKIYKNCCGKGPHPSV